MNFKMEQINSRLSRNSAVLCMVANIHILLALNLVGKIKLSKKAKCLSPVCPR